MHLVSIVAALAGLAAGNLQEPNGAYVTTLTLSGELPGQGRLGGVAVDADGAIYVSNFGATVWRVDPDGTVTALTSDLRGSSGNAVMPDGSLLQGSFLDNRVVRIARDGTSRTYATGFSGPVGIAVTADGTAYVCNCKENSIAKVAPDGSVSVFAQSGLLDCPNGIVIDPNGDLVVASFKSPTLVRIGPSGIVERWVDVMDDGNAHLAWVGEDLYVTKVASNRIYRVTPDDAVSLFAGTGEPGDRDGPALEAQLAHPNGIAAVPGGNVLIVNTIVGEWRSDSATRLALRKISLAEEQGFERIELRVGDLVFEALATGPHDGELVLLLHGFPQTGHAFRHQLRALGQAGFRAVAPDQRGYSPGARPEGVEPYAMNHLVADAVGMADALGRDRFHLVGHDWGGAVAWVVATRYPARVRTLTVLSTPHFAAFGAARAKPESDQAKRSSYFADFAAPGAEQRFLADDKAFFRSFFAELEVPQEDLAVYFDRLGTPEAMRAALNWYSALTSAGSGATRSTGIPPSIKVPTLYVWGGADEAFGRATAESTADFVSGRYTFVPLDGQGHWLPEAAADTVTSLLLHHLGPTESATGHSLGNYRRARQLLQRADSALSGPSVRDFENLQVQFKGSSLARGQGYRPGPPFDTTEVSGQLVYDSDDRVFLDHRSFNRGGTDRSFRRVLADSGSWNYWTSRRLLSPIAASDVTLLRRGPWYAPRTFPHSLVASAYRAAASLRWLGDTREDGRDLGWIAFGIGDDLVANLAIDQATGLPYRVERLGSDPLLGDVANGVRFDGYRDVGGLMVPHRLTFTLNDLDLRAWSLTDVRVNQPVDEGLFQPPEGVDNAVHPRRFVPAEVAPGVYLVRLYSGPANSYNTMLVVFDEFVVVVEAPLADAFFPVYQRIARRVAPGKPIKYVVTTHHHSDHVGGVRRFLAAGIDVLTPPQAASQIARMVTAEPTISRNPLAGSGARGRIIPVSDSLVISDGSRSLRLLQVGPTPHVEQILVAHVPDAGVLFVADLFAIPENRVFPSPSPTFRHFAELFGRIDRDGGIQIIVPAHGIVGSPADVEAAVSVVPR